MTVWLQRNININIDNNNNDKNKKALPFHWPPPPTPPPPGSNKWMFCFLYCGCCCCSILIKQSGHIFCESNDWLIDWSTHRSILPYFIHSYKINRSALCCCCCCCELINQFKLIDWQLYNEHPIMIRIETFSWKQQVFFIN